MQKSGKCGCMGSARWGKARGEGKAAQSHRQSTLPAAYPYTGCHFKITKDTF